MENVIWSQTDQDYLLKNLGPTALLLKNKKILIAGGSGFLGAVVVEALELINSKFDLKLKIVVLSRERNNFDQRFPKSTLIQFLQGDLYDLKPPPDSFDYMIHTAQDPNEVIDPKLEDDHLLKLTRATEVFARWAARDHAKLIYFSSGAVYGLTDSSYKRSKLRSEETVKDLSQKFKFPLLIVRCFSFVGPHMPLHGRFAASQLISQSARGQNLVMQGDGTPVRSFLYSADFAVWIIKMLASEIDRGTYDVGSPEAFSISEMAEVISEICGLTPPQFLGNANTSLGAPSIYVPDVSQTMKDFSLPKPLPLKEAVIRTLAWAKQVLSKDPNWPSQN